VTDDERDQQLSELLMSILDSPTESWDKSDIDDMREATECGEYEVALTNLIAAGLQSDEGFTDSQRGTLNALIKLMDLEDSEWVLKLQEWQATHSPS
jgi:hypothetical protein